MDRSQKHKYQRRTTNKKVAIVGIGCRFPSDIKNVREFWEVISAGTDCMKPHPKERLDPSFLYPGEKIPGKIYSRAAGYLSQNINEFDRLFFQTSPEEADHMDPQLRLLLEVVWESLEDYGVSVADLRKSDTGVYVGVMAREYLSLISDPNININKYTASGNNSNMISNRISYHFDFQGPSITYDTACSSSMYAIHHACEAIRNEDCNLVLAGGVNLFLLPSTFIALSQAEMLSPDGKCKSFDSAADGYSRGEGAGMLVLKSLEQSMIDGDRIYAVITGGSLNNDGKTSGITAPSTRAQICLLQQAYDNANLSPHEVPYVEAHGTGTQAGDTAELSAIGSVMRKGRGEKHPPLFIGSVKSNIGHTEGAAGVAGVIKAALVLQKRQIPKVVHFQSKNRNISWDDTGEMIFPTELTRWPDGFKYIAGCSSFGFGGANAHVVLESAPPQDKCHKKENYFPALLFLSAASKDALSQRATDWLKFLRKSSDSDFWNIVRTAATRVTHHPYRLAICAQSLEQSITILEERQNSPLGVNNMLVEGRVQAMPSDQNQKLVFVFSGMGTQWWGMGRQLMQVNAVFRRTIIDADKLLREFGAKWSLQVMLTTETDKEMINDTAIAQPSICAVQIALAEVYRHLGILPHAVVGHSVGEVAAACVAGYITFHDAMRLIYIRGRSLRRTAEKGTMAAIFKEVNEVEGKLSENEFLGKVDIACVNSATQTVISGNSDAIAKLVDFYKSQGVRCVSLKVRNAFHSFQQEQIKKYFFKHALSKLFQNRMQSGGKYLPRQVPMVSTVTSEFVTAKDLNDSTYWWQNIRQTVWFEESLKKLLKNGYNVFLEISPHPSLTSSIKHTMGVFLNKIEVSFHEEHTVIGSLKKPDDVSQTSQDNVSILMSIAKLYTRGYPLNLKMIFPNEPFNVISLPSYPWQRQLCLAVTEEAKRRYITPKLKHPLLGQPQEIFCDESDIENRRAWKSDYDLASLPWLPHHKIENAILLPGAAFIDMMLTVAKEIQVGFDTVTLKNIQFHKFHYSPQCHGKLSTTAIRSNSGSQWDVAVRTCNESDKSWVQNATCTFDLSADNISTHEKILDVNDIQEKCDTFLTRERFYQHLAEKSVEIGSMFGSVSCAFYNIGRQECLIFAAIPEIVSNECNDFIFHPCLLDAAFQLFAGFSIESESPTGRRTVEVPQSASIVCLKGSAPSEIVFHGRKFVENGKEYVNATIANSKNQKIFATLEQVQLVALGSNVKDDRIQFFEKEWTAVAPEETVSSTEADTMPSIPLQNVNQEDYLIVSDSAKFADMFIHAFLKAGISPEHLVKRNLSDKFDNPFSKGESSFLNVIVLTFMNVADFKSLDDISRDQFLQSQINEPVSLIHTITGLYSKFDLKQLSIWIVTKGAVVAVESDTSVNPLMSNGLTLNMTLMNENPDLFVTTLDLPLNQSPEDSVQWLCKFFLKPERSENCLALRKVKSKDFQMFSLRLSFPSTPSISIKKKSDKWFFDISSEVKGNPLKAISLKTVKATNDECETSQRSEISVQVEAFCKQYRKSISKPKERSVGFLFCGNIIQSTNRDGEKVIGYIRNNIVRPSVTTKSRDVVSISEKGPIRASQALFVIQKCFPLYLALQETFKGNEGSVIIITADDANFNIYREFGYLITSSEKTKVAQVIIYVQNAQQLPSNLQTHEKVELATKQTLHAKVRDGIVDTLLIHSNCVVTSKEADPLFNKVRFHGTIAVLGDILVNSNVIKARQIGVRTVEPEYMWESVNADLTHKSISSLLDLFFSNGELSEDTNHLINAVKVDEIGDGQDIDSNIFLASADLNVPFGYNDSIHLFKAKPNSSYLVVGGTNGLGREIARWLVCQGAMRVYISGRSEPASQELGKMKSVEYIKCDITNEKETEKMLQTLKNGPFPLTGIFHCAALFEDQKLEKVTKEAWTKVTLPKAYGLLLLHKLTTKLKIPLETFVALSSIVEYLGNDGQGSYCNANAFVSSLCLERRLQTLPGTFVAPGAIQDVGYAARKGYDKMWAKRGITALCPSEVINCISWLLLNKSKGIGVTGTLHMENFIKSKTQVFNHQLKTKRLSIFKREFHAGMLYSGSSTYSTNLLASLNPPEAITVIKKVLNDFLLTRMGISEDIPPELPFSSLGFDSAMSWELSSLIWSQFNIVVTSLELLNDSSNLSNISSLILNRSSKSNAQENDSANKNVGFANTLWLNTPRGMSSPHADLICFPPTGKGVSLFAGWVEKFETSGIQVTVAQLPGWEARENEPASNDLTYLVTELSNAILSRPTLTRLVFFGCGIGALLAFEIARFLQTEHNITIKHVFICAWYPPSTPYASSMELKEPTKGEESVLSTDNKTAKFLDNRDIRQSQFPEKAFLNMKASETICKSYKYVMSEPLECNMTIYTGVRDPILTQKVVGKWKNEINPEKEFENVALQTDHKLLRVKKLNDKIASHLSRSLLKENKTRYITGQVNDLMTINEW